MARALIVAASLFAAVAQESGPDVHYVANSGMLVTVSGRRFLIDAPIRDGISGYPTSSAEERARLESAQTPVRQGRCDPDYALVGRG